jgi:Zn-dependent protease with chaperone function
VDGGFGAFTYGRFPGDVRLVVSRGVVKNLSADELQAVLAHEMGHIFRWDFAIMTVAQLIPAILKTLIE